MDKVQKTGYRHIKAKPIVVVAIIHVPGTITEIVKHAVPYLRRRRPYVGAMSGPNLGQPILHGDFI